MERGLEGLKGGGGEGEGGRGGKVEQGWMGVSVTCKHVAGRDRLSAAPHHGKSACSST